jgi:3-oxoacyl-[acyl-carrier-protein] synthase II
MSGGKSSREVVITGVGTVTALGSGVDAFWQGLLSGRPGVGPVSLFDPSRYQCRVAAQVSLVPEDPRGETKERAHRLALAAAAEALASCPGFGGPRAGIVAGTTLGGNRLFTDWLAARGGPNPDLPAQSSLGSAARILAMRFGARGPVQTVSVACASGTAAIGAGLELIRRGEADRVLAGGYDALSEFVFSGFDCLRALTRSKPRPFDRARDGLALGEGAAFVLLEERGAASRRGVEALAVVRGYASASDSLHMTRPSPDGAGLVRAIEGALLDAAVPPSSVGFISSHGTATPFNDRMEAAAFRTVFGEALRAVPVNSIKGAIGHTLGAAGALEAVMSALALSRGVLPPTLHHEENDPACGLDIVAGTPRELSREARIALSTSSAFAGTNAALVLERA